MKKLLTLPAILALTLMFVLTVSAEPLKKDPPLGDTGKLPEKGASNVLVYSDFEDGKIEPFSATVPDDQSIAPANVQIVSDQAHSGSKSVKVSARGGNADGTQGGYNTIQLKDIAPLIAEKFEKDAANANKTETYFISAWVKNVDPTVTQNFWLQLQYGGWREVWLPGANYYPVKGSEWKQIGMVVKNGVTRYQPFTEDSTKSGIYLARGTTTWSGLKFITKEMRDADGNVKQTAGDFYIDDIVIWKVTDSADILSEDAVASETPQSSETSLVEPVDSSDTTPSDSSKDNSSEETIPEKTDSNTGIIIAIIAAAVVIGGAILGGMIFISKSKNPKPQSDEKKDENQE